MQVPFISSDVNLGPPSAHKSIKDVSAYLYFRVIPNKSEEPAFKDLIQLSSISSYFGSRLGYSFLNINRSFRRRMTEAPNEDELDGHMFHHQYISDFNIFIIVVKSISSAFG